jgi:hypothetical protein
MLKLRPVIRCKSIYLYHIEYMVCEVVFLKVLWIGMKLRMVACHYVQICFGEE